jgi:hypothetical protein
MLSSVMEMYRQTDFNFNKIIVIVIIIIIIIIIMGGHKAWANTMCYNLIMDLML